MVTARISTKFVVSESDDEKFLVQGAVCRYLDDNGREVETDRVEVRRLFKAVPFATMTITAIRDALKAEVKRLAELEKPTDVHKRFKGMTIE